MAHNHVCAFLVIALILFATANPLAHTTLLSLNVSGLLCCTSSGNCPGGAAVAGVVVGLNCTSLLGVSTQVGQTTTNAQGRFNINVGNAIGSIIPVPALPRNGTILPCVAIVELPLNQTLCPVLSTVNGTLVGVTQVVGSVFTLLRSLLNVSVVEYVNLAI